MPVPAAEEELWLIQCGLNSEGFPQLDGSMVRFILFENVLPLHHLALGYFPGNGKKISNSQPQPDKVIASAVA